MPLISVIITTYNHEKYIAQAIESALSQRDCPCFEILIGNDCSIDKTGQIIEEYQKKYPDITKVFSYSQNIGMQKNLKNLIENSKGEYVAILEGDDWWIDDLRLNKMYNRMIGDPKASLCFSNLKRYIQDEDKYIEHIDKNRALLIGDKITIEKFIELGNPIINFSCTVYRKKYLDNLPKEYWDGKNADFACNMYILDMAHGLCIDEVLSVYRMHKNAQWSSLSEAEKRVKIIDAYWQFNKIFKNKYFDIFLKRIYEFVFCYIGVKPLFSGGGGKEKTLFELQFPISRKKNYAF